MQVHRPPHTAKRGLSTRCTFHGILGRGVAPLARASEPRETLAPRVSKGRGMNGVFYVVNALIVAAVGAIWFFVWLGNRKRVATEVVGRAEEAAARLVRDATREAESRKKEALLEAKEKTHELVVEAERQARERRQQLTGIEQGLHRREEKLTERGASLEQREKEIRGQEQALHKRTQATTEAEAKYQSLVVDQQRELQRVAGLTADEAREILLKQIEADAKRDAANLVKRLEAEARESAAQKARQIITEAIQRSAAEHAVETTVSVVDLPSDDLKGRIIGREGRNIRALEIATGVDLIVDDTPGAIILSGFDPYRREIAKHAIERLIADGRIHPARIEEVVEKVKAELDEEVRREGEAAAFELGLHDLHPEVLRLMGRLKYRTSYGQNVLNHSKEVAFLAGVMAREVGLQTPLAVRAAFLHDIGKAIDREMQGTHLELGLEFLRKHGEQQPVLDHDCPGRRCDLGRQARRQARHPRVLREAAGEARGDRRLVQGRVQSLRAAGGPGNPDHGRKREDHRRRSGLAVEGHRPAHRERARVPGPDQGDRHPGDARG